MFAPAPRPKLVARQDDAGERRLRVRVASAAISAVSRSTAACESVFMPAGVEGDPGDAVADLVL